MISVVGAVVTAWSVTVVAAAGVTTPTEVPNHHTENNHSWYPMLEAFMPQQAPKRMPLSSLLWQGERPIFHAV